MGKSALEGLNGVHRVASGFLGHREVNTVIYDPSVVSVDAMVRALRSAGTYQGMAVAK